MMKKRWTRRILSFLLVFSLSISSPFFDIFALDTRDAEDEALGFSLGISGYLPIAPLSYAFPFEILCSKDTFVVDNTSVDYSLGDNRWNLSLSNNLMTRSVIFEFDLTGVSDEDVERIGSVRLAFDLKNYTLEQPTYVRAYGMADDIWPYDLDIGSGMTGKIAMENKSGVIEGAHVFIDGMGSYSIDVTEYIIEKYEAGSRFVNIMLKADPTADTYGSINITPRDNGKNSGARLKFSEDRPVKPEPIPLPPVTYFCTKDTFVSGTSTVDYSVTSNMWNLYVCNNALKRSAILEFDLSAASPQSIEQMTNAVLTVEARIYTLEAPTYLRAYEMDDDVWPYNMDIGSGMTGALAVKHMGMAIPGAWTYVDDIGKYQLDITEYIREKYEAGSRKINLALKVDPTIGSTSGSINLTSRNTSTAKSAQIRIGYETDAPQPAPIPQDDMLMPCSKDTYVIPDNKTDYSAAANVILSDSPQKSYGVYEFDLTDLPDEVFSESKTVHLKLDAQSYALERPAYVSAREMPDTIWPRNAEPNSGLTGEIAVPVMGANISRARVYVDEAGKFELDVTNYVRQKYNAGIKIFNIAVAVENSSGSIDLVSMNQDRTRAAMLRLGFEDAPETTVITYINTKDTYVMDTNSTDYSTGSNLWNIILSNNLQRRAGIFEFDLSDIRRHVIDGMTQTKLVFELKSFSMTNPINVRAYGLPDNIWPNSDRDSGSGLTGAVLASVYPQYRDRNIQDHYAIPGAEALVGSVGKYEIDITDYIRERYEAGARKINIMLLPDYDDRRVYESMNVMPRDQSKTTSTRLLIETTSPPPADGKYPLDIPHGLDTDTLTTTRYNDWLVNLHLTTPEQVLAGYKGGEGWQMVWSMAISPTDRNQLIFGIDTTGIWKSEDNGYNWRPSNNNFSSIAALSLAFDPENENIIYAVGGSMSEENSSIYPYATGMYKSVDGGKNWSFLTKTMMTRRFNAGIIAFGKDQGGNKVIYFGTQKDGLMRSTDGATFTTIPELAEVGIVNGIYTDNNLRVAVATDNRGLIVSEDGGKTWSEKNAGLPVSVDGTVSAQSITVNPIDTRHWIVIAGYRLYASYDAGGSWVNLPSADDQKQNVSDAQLLKVTFSAAPESGNPYLYIEFTRLSYPLRVSNDYGATWSRPKYNTELGYIKSNSGYFSEGLAVDPANSENIWISHLGEIYRSSDGGKNFYPSNSGYSGALVTTVLFNPDDEQDVLVGAIDFGMSRSMPSSELPTSQKGKYPIFNYITVRNVSDLVLNPPISNAIFEGSRSTHGIARDPNDSQHLFASVGNWSRSCILESTDGGYNWKTRTGIINDSSAGMRLQYHDNDSNFIYAGQYYSNNNGVTWTKLKYVVHAISPANNDIVFAKSGGKIYISRDRGKNWAQILTRYDFQDSYFFNGAQVITPDMEDVNSLWVGRWGVSPLRLTLDPGTNRVTTYIEYGTAEGFKPDTANNTIMWIIVQNPNNPNHLVSGGVNHYRMVPNSCFYESYDKGRTWHEVPGMEGSRDVRTMKFHPTLPQLWICTSAGIWVYEYKNFSFAPPGDGGDGSGGSSTGGGGLTTIVDSDVPLSQLPIQPVYWYEPAEINPLATEARSKGMPYVATNRTSPAGIRKSALLLMGGLRYDHDTMLGKSVQVRVSIPNPAKAADDILLTGYVSGSAVQKTKSLFNKWYQNKVTVVCLEQMVGFGQPVNISAKTDLAGMNKERLVFYSYNAVSNTYTQIKTPGYWVDANGYLRFTTELGGDIIVSDGPLLRK